MEKQVLLSIRGQQIFEGVQEPEVTELMTEGTLHMDDNHNVTLVYQESELTGLEGTQTTIQVMPESVTILREGEVNSQMVFQEGRKHLSLYNTPFGALTMGVSTRKMHVDLDETGGSIEIDYSIEIDHAVAGQNLFQIYVRTRNIPQ